eukprot:754611-Alexandrium_andersonii.AAC.1
MGRAGRRCGHCCRHRLPLQHDRAAPLRRLRGGADTCGPGRPFLPRLLRGPPRRWRSGGARSWAYAGAPRV